MDEERERRYQKVVAEMREDLKEMEEEFTDIEAELSPNKCKTELFIIDNDSGPVLIED